MKNRVKPSFKQSCRAKTWRNFASFSTRKRNSVASNLEKFKPEFKRVVLEHIKTLDPVEWIRLRSMAANTRRHIPSLGHTLELSATAEALVNEWTMNDSISVREVMGIAEETEVAGWVDELPVHYLKGKGIYIWCEQIDSRDTLSFWVTTPAYPPGW